MDDPYTGDAAAPRELQEKIRVYVLPTRHGYSYICILAAMLLGSINYGSNLGFLLTFLLGAMAIVSIFHTCGNIADIRVLSVQANPVFAGERAIFECIVENRGNPAIAVSLAFFDGCSEAEGLAAGTEAKIRIGMETPGRGIISPGTLTISSRYPMGLFRAWKRVSIPARCLVYPHPLQGPLETGNDTSAEDASGKGITTGVDDFQGLKSYQPGDNLQHISWKAFSRGQGLFTKNFSGQQGTSKMLDWEALKEPDVEKKLSRLCGMVLRAHHDQLTFGLNLPGRTIRPGRGETHRRSCLKALALHGIS